MSLIWLTSRHIVQAEPGAPLAFSLRLLIFAPRSLSSHASIRLRTCCTNSLACRVVAKRPEVSLSPNRSGVPAPGIRKVRLRGRRDPAATKSARSQVVAAGFLPAGAALVPTHGLAMVPTGGRSAAASMPSCSPVGGGAFRVTTGDRGQRPAARLEHTRLTAPVIDASSRSVSALRAPIVVTAVQVVIRPVRATATA